MEKPRSIYLMSCHHLADFPVHAQGDDAESLLAYWTAPWHPALLHCQQSIPRWVSGRPSEIKSVEVDDALVFVPNPARETLQNVGEWVDFLNRCDQPTTKLFESSTHGVDRESLAQAAIAAMAAFECDDAQAVAAKINALEINSLQAKSPTQPSPGGLVGDFYALGFYQLQTELLTQRMHFVSQLDLTRFEQHAVAAADALVAGDADQTREQLQVCFSALSEERDHYYPVSAYFLDYTLASPATRPQHWRKRLKDSTATNVFASAATLAKMAVAEETREYAERLRERQAAGSLNWVGNGLHDLPLEVLPIELIQANLTAGQAVAVQQQMQFPTCFGQISSGLSPRLLPMLRSTGFQTVVHAALGWGQVPATPQARIQWENSQGEVFDAVDCQPLDAARVETFLDLANRIAETMELDYVATVCLAHWAGAASPWYDDLRRGTAYSPALGQFITLDEYFANSSVAAGTDTTNIDQYRSQHLISLVNKNVANPISQVVDGWRLSSRLDAAANLAGIGTILSGQKLSPKWTERLRSTQVELARSATCSESGRPLPPIETGVDRKQLAKQLTQSVDNLTAEAIAGLGRAIGCYEVNESNESEGEPEARLVLNPYSNNQRVAVDTDRPLDAGAATYARDSARTIVDVAGCGFQLCWPAESSPTTAASVSAPAEAPSSDQPLPPIVGGDAQTPVLRNEFLEAHIDTTTGGIRSIYDFHTRGNRLSQRLAYRRPEQPTEMRCETSQVTTNTMTTGVVTTSGGLFDASGQRIADFQQSIELQRGSRLLQLAIHLEPTRDLNGPPWEDYFASRWAVAKDHLDWIRCVHGLRHATKAQRIVSPLYVEASGPSRKTAILCGGLPYHQHDGGHVLDSLLLVRGETARDFEMAVAIDVPSVYQMAKSYLTPPLIPQVRVPSEMMADANRSGWLFHLNTPHVVTTGWAPVFESGDCDSNPAAPATGAPTGFRVRLLESAGRGGQVALTAFREIKSARKVDFLGQVASECEVDEGRALISVLPHEWTEVECRW